MSDVRVALVSRRPPVEALFDGLSQRHVPPFSLAGKFTPSEIARGRFPASFFGATVAVVDIYPDPYAVLDVCRAIRARCAELPIAGVVCCPASACVADLEVLRDSGLTSLLNWESDPRHLAAQLRHEPHPGSALQFRGAPTTKGKRSRGSAPADVARLLDPMDRRIAALVAHGWSNKAIGRVVHLTHHGVDHRVEDLCRATRVRNRAELAAWAGMHGIYPGPEPSMN